MPLTTPSIPAQPGAPLLGRGQFPSLSLPGESVFFSVSLGSTLGSSAGQLLWTSPPALLGQLSPPSAIPPLVFTVSACFSNPKECVNRLVCLETSGLL